jgi:cobalt-zinc-cadmium efflux system protein
MHVHGVSTAAMKKVLWLSLVGTILYVLLTLVAGLRAHSLALVSEAGHNASDALAILLSFVAVWFQTRPATDRKTFGYQRAGVLAAFMNAITLIVIAGWIAVEAAHRFQNPAAAQPRIMMYVAGAGLAKNGVIAALLWRVNHDVNIRSVFIHMLGDTLSTAAVIAGGAAIVLTGRNWIDPALSLGIAALILWSSLDIVRETLNILLEGTPRGLSLGEIRSTLEEIEGVEDVHDLHVWSLGSNTHALASHVTIADIPPSESNRILDRINVVLRERFRIHHTTLQFEHVVCETSHGCLQVVEEMEEHHHHHHHHGHAH